MKKNPYIGSFKIDLKEKTNDEKYAILKWLKPLATNYCRGHYSISRIERIYSLIGSNALRGFECFSIYDRRFCAHLDEAAFIMLPYEPLEVNLN